MRELIDQIDAIPATEDHVDVLIHSTGGDALAAWKLMSILRERFNFVAVLVPYMAFSAATLFCLGADEIVMHPHASLGPIDPQITIPQADGQPRDFSFEDVRAFLRFLKEEIGLSEQVHTTSVVEKLLSVVDAVHVGGAKRASELSTDVGERLLRMHMKNADEQGQARRIAEGLNKSFFAHGDAVSRSRARDLQLKVANDNPELENLIWNAYLGLESHMAFRSPFAPLQYFIETAGEQSISPAAPVVLPSNTPQEVVQQIWNQVANAALQNLTTPPVEVSYELIPAVIESKRQASEYQVHGKITAVRMMGGDIQLNVTQTSAGWNPVDVDRQGAGRPGDRQTSDDRSPQDNG